MDDKKLLSQTLIWEEKYKWNQKNNKHTISNSRNWKSKQKDERRSKKINWACQNFRENILK